MKTSIKTLFATALTAIILLSTTGSTFAADPDGIKSSTAVDFSKGINMVVVTGNVNVYLTQSNKEDINFSTNQNEDVKVSIKQIGAKLYISAPKNEKVTVYLHLKDLKRIDASNTACVKTKGNFKLDVLQIFLRDDAKANLNINSGSLYTVIKDHSTLKLSGATGEHELVKNMWAKLKMDDFNAVKMQARTTGTSLAFNQGH